ncbi:hypothetical protein B0O99DRAFT_582561 [Bisporella sp. PMI_857]|nr:hypothetical protein B0O99DRAFT_582561 [Bisporella sp. PMI_857]
MNTHHDFGKRLLVTELDRTAQENPAQIFAALPVQNDILRGYRDINFKTISRAVNRMAWWIDSRIGRSTTFQTIAYRGARDIRYLIIVLAAIKCGFKMLLPSHVNSTFGTLKLLDETDCIVFLHSKDVFVDEIAAGRELEILQVPELEELLESGDVELFPYDKTFEEAKNDPILHTSGSTGFPKPIFWSNYHYAAIDAAHLLQPFNGHGIKTTLSGKSHRKLAGCEMFHAAGNITGLTGPIFDGKTIVYLPSSMRARDITPEFFISLMSATAINSATFLSMIIERLSTSPEAITTLEQLSSVTYIGAPLPKRVGDLVSQRVRLQNIYGATESGPLPQWELEREDWEYICTKPQYFEKLSPDAKQHELVFRRDEDDPTSQAALYSFPELDMYRSGDLFSRHPTKPDLWRFEGRKDNTMVVTWGPNINPAPIEQYVEAQPWIGGAVAVDNGSGLSLLVELEHKTTFGDQDLIHKVWKVVEEVNKHMRTIEQIGKENIILVDALPRTDKGTVMRKRAMELFNKLSKSPHHDCE